MITDYNDYINKIEDNKQKTLDLIEELKDKLKEDIENECSKYLSMIQPYDNYDKVFLIDDDFGVMILTKYYDAAFETQKIYAEIYTVFKNDNNNWVKSSDNKEFKLWHTQTIEDFVKNTIDTLKKRNIKRKLDKEKRALKRTANKYNI